MKDDMIISTLHLHIYAFNYMLPCLIILLRLEVFEKKIKSALDLVPHQRTLKFIFKVRYGGTSTFLVLRHIC